MASLKQDLCVMEIYLNGEKKRISGDENLGALVARFGIEPDSVVIEHNEAIVARPEWDKTRIAEGDKIEIVRFVGGG